MKKILMSLAALCFLASAQVRADDAKSNMKEKEGEVKGEAKSAKHSAKKKGKKAKKDMDKDMDMGKKGMDKKTDEMAK